MRIYPFKVSFYTQFKCRILISKQKIKNNFLSKFAYLILCGYSLKHPHPIYYIHHNLSQKHLFKILF